MMARSRSSIKATGGGLLFCFVISGLPCTPAHAQTRGAFQVHYEQALKMYEASDYLTALKEFEAAYAIQQLPRLLLNIGQTHRKLGHGKEVMSFCQSYLQLEPDPEPEIKAKADTCIEQGRLMIGENERIAAQQAERDRKATEQAEREQKAKEVARVPLQLPKPAPAPTATRALPAGALAMARPTHKAEGRPLYKRWWFWTTLGAVAAGATTAALLTTHPWEASMPSFQTKDALFHDTTKP